MLVAQTHRPGLETPGTKARRATPSNRAHRNRATIWRVSDTWPPPGPRKRPPTLEHVRDVWTLRYVETNCTAAIWRNNFRLELRVEHGGKLIESRLLRYGDQTEAIERLQRVIIMTPENLHLNSFMYEPILDMSDEHLRKLHTDIVALGTLAKA